MRVIHGVLFVALAGMIVGSAPALAQQGRLRGVVTEAGTKKPLDDVQIVYKHTSMGNTKKAKTNSKGEYRIVDVRFGEYGVTVEKKGYKTFRGVYNIEPVSNEVAVIHFELTPEAPAPSPPESK